MQDNYKDRLHLLTWIAALVLLVACANVANLMLVRGMGRRAEMSIRAALGARRSRIIRQLLTESVLLAGLGAVLGLGVSFLGARMLLTLAFPGELHVPIDPAPSRMVVAFACGLALLTGILFGVAPAYMASRAQPADALRSKARTTTYRASYLQRGLVVLQAALSLVLLVGAGLFAQSLNKLQSTDLKLDATNRYVIHISPQSAGYTTTQVEALYRTIEERFHSLPGVMKVSLATYTPMEENNWSTGIKVEGEPDINKSASFVKGTSEYFDSVGTRLVMGRGFTPLDTLSAPPVAVVNQEFTKQFFAGRNPIGHRFGFSQMGKDSAYEIVGVVDDTTYTSIYWKNHAMYFVPLTQRPAHSDDPVEKDLSMYAGAIVVQTARPVPDMEKLALTTLTAINPNLTIVKFQTFQQQIEDQFTNERMVARLTSLFGGLALLLAAVGLYGVTAYSVVRRTPEIGVRMALGARRGRVIAMVMRGALMQALFGLVIGVPVALLCVRYIKSQLYEISHVNGVLLAGAIVILCLASAIAGIIPARRAASIDPVRALRIE
jgi:predicted permease